MCEHTGLAELNLLDRLRAGLDTLRAAGRVPLGGAVSDVELTQAVQMLEAAARVCQGIKLAMVDEIAQRHAHRGQAARNTEDLLARVLHLAPGEARAQADLAAGLALVPDTAAALRDGRIGIGQAAVTVKKADEVKTRDDAQDLLAKIDQTASTAGQRLDRNRLAREIDTGLAKSNMDVLADRERTAFQRRSLSWTVRDGMHVLHAELDPVGGSTVRAMLDSLSAKTDERDTRSFPQRQSDALVRMGTLAKGNEGNAQGTLQSARILLATSGVRACDGTARRLSRGPALAWGSGTLSSPSGGPAVRPAAPAGASRASRGARRVRRASREPGRGCSRFGSGPRGQVRGAPTSAHAGWAAPEVRQPATTRHAAGAATPTSTNTAGR